MEIVKFNSMVPQSEGFLCLKKGGSQSSEMSLNTCLHMNGSLLDVSNIYKHKYTADSDDAERGKQSSVKQRKLQISGLNW